ncbi:tetratricopeptide repeat protein, partial [Vibrio aerogenes]
MTGTQIGRDNSGVSIGGDVEGGVHFHTRLNQTKQLPRVLSSLPQFLSESLIGRQSVEQSLYQTLTNQETTSVRLLLQGIGGIGKTSLAKALFARSYADDSFSHLIWLHANNPNELARLAQSLNVDVTQEHWPQQLTQTLSNLPGPCLAVIDNLSQETQQQFTLLMRCPNWRILATSRHQLGGFHKEHIQFLAEEECIELYLQHCEFDDDREQVRKLVQQAGYHTLVVELFGKTAANSGTTAADLCQTLTNTGFDLSSTCQETVEACYGEQEQFSEQLLYDHIRMLFDIATLDDVQKIILKQIAVLGTSAHAADHLTQWLSLDNKTPLQKLVKTGWLQRSQDENNQQFFSLHPVIVDVACREIYLTDEITDRLTENVVESLAVGETGHGIEHQDKFAAAGAFAQYLWDIQNRHELPLVFLMNQLGYCLYQSGLYPEALPLFQRALAICEASLGESHPDVATSLNNLAGLYKSQGQYPKALPLYERALAIREASLGESHPDVAGSLNNLAGLYQSQGQYPEALPLFQRALAICEASLGESHPDVATSLNNLALLYDSQGQYPKALPLYERALAIYEASLGESHPSVATSLNNLALLYDSQGQYPKALPLYERALAIREASLGESHPSVATSLNNLAGLYKSQGQYP